MILYKFLEKTLGKIQLMEPVLGDSPIHFVLRSNMIWLGNLTKRVEIEIRKSRTVLGWLYSETDFVYFSHDNQLYECPLDKLRERAENRIMENGRKFVETPEINCLHRSERTQVGRIITLLAIEDLLGISGKIEIKEVA